MKLVEGAPPEIGGQAVRPASEHLLAHPGGGHPFRRHPGAEAPHLLREGGLAGNGRVEQALRDGMQRVAEGVERPAVRLDAERGRIGVRSEGVQQLALHLEAPPVGALPLRTEAVGSLAVHARNDGTRRILDADRRGNHAKPVPRLRRLFDRVHAVALVAEVPRDDRLAVPEATDERAGETALPHQGLGICDQVEVLDDARRKETTRHPARDERHQELHAVRLREVAEPAEARQRAGVEPERIENLLVRAVAEDRPELALVLAAAHERLEFAPRREDAHQLDAVRGERRDVALDRRLVPLVLAPHPDARLRAPVVHARPKTPIKRKCAHFVIPCQQ